MITLRRCTSDDAVFRALVAELDAELWRRYGELQATFVPHNKIDALDTVLVAAEGDRPVGCGCFKPFDEATVELKRMYVASDARGRGIAAQLLAGLEAWAHERGAATMILETGPNQPEAVALYEKAGYTRIARFGPYVQMPTSICMAKPLSRR
jgi:GNAT superfamily N-acetyltransferase